MSHSNFAQRKADEFGIDLKSQPDYGQVLVYKLMLEGIREALKTDLREVIEGSIGNLIKDLLDFVNEIDELRDTPTAKTFVKSKWIRSVEALFTSIREAYRELCTASDLLKDKEETVASRRRSFYDALFNCREALRKAQRQILIP